MSTSVNKELIKQNSISDSYSLNFSKMTKVNLAVIYYSATGASYKLAWWAAEAAQEGGAEVRLLKVQELAPEAAIVANPAWKKHRDEALNIPTVSLADLEWADAIIFSVPTRYGNAPSQVQQFLDTTGTLWYEGKLQNKVVSAMTTAAYPHGGQEATLISLYLTMMHWGAIIATPGFHDPATYSAGGNPYGASATVDTDGNIKEDVQEAVNFQAKRTVQVAESIKRGLQMQDF